MTPERKRKKMFQYGPERAASYIHLSDYVDDTWKSAIHTRAYLYHPIRGAAVASIRQSGRPV